MVQFRPAPNSFFLQISSIFDHFYIKSSRYLLFMTLFPNKGHFGLNAFFEFILRLCGQNEITKFHQKSEFLMIFEIYFYICTVDWWSQISALQVGISQIM